MAVYEITAVGTAHEFYRIEAASEGEARAKFDSGEIMPETSEVEGIEIDTIREEEP